MQSEDAKAYINHPLNFSQTKQAFTFTKSNRFDFSPRKSSNDVFYNLPTTKAKRSCSFGYGNKIGFADRYKVLPPPGSYEPPTDFNPKNAKHNTISFSPGRKEVKFGYFLGSAERLKTLPSPNAYVIKQNHYSKKGGRMAAKLPTQIEMVAKNKFPGPGTYGLDVTEMKNSGSFILSRYKNQLSPKYTSPQRVCRSRSCSPDPGQYNVNAQQFGKSIVSKFKNTATNLFGKEKRPGMEDRSKKNFPSFKYKVFSQFGGPGKG